METSIPPLTSSSSPIVANCPSRLPDNPSDVTRAYELVPMPPWSSRMEFKAVEYIFQEITHCWGMGMREAGNGNRVAQLAIESPDRNFSNSLRCLKLLASWCAHKVFVMEPPILLAEDSENDAVYFERQLRLAGIQNPLRVVTDGEEAIDYLFGNGKYADRAQFPGPLILFLDLRLPRINGYQVLSFLRATAEYRHLPVIALSCMHEIKDVAEAYQRGVNSFLMKPLDSAELLEALRVVPSLSLTRMIDGFRIEPVKFASLSSRTGMGDISQLAPN